MRASGMDAHEVVERITVRAKDFTGPPGRPLPGRHPPRPGRPRHRGLPTKTSDEQRDRLTRYFRHQIYPVLTLLRPPTRSPTSRGSRSTSPSSCATRAAERRPRANQFAPVAAALITVPGREPQRRRQGPRHRRGAPGGRDRPAPRPPLPGHGDPGAPPSASPATRTLRWRRTTPRTSSPPWRRSLNGAARAMAARGGGHHQPLRAPLPGARAWASPPTTCSSPAPRPRASTAHDFDVPEPGALRPVPVTAAGLAAHESSSAGDTFAAIREHEVPCTTPTTPSTRCRSSSPRPPATPGSWPSNRPSTAPAATRRSSTPSSRLPRQARRWWRSWRSRHASTRRPTSPGRVRAGRRPRGLPAWWVSRRTCLILVVRQEPDGLRRYAAGCVRNYHPKTARGYEDLGLLTCDRDVGSRTTYPVQPALRLRAPRPLPPPPGGTALLRDGLVERIEREIAHKAEGKEAWIRIKVNSIIDETLIDALSTGPARRGARGHRGARNLRVAGRCARAQ